MISTGAQRIYGTLCFELADIIVGVLCALVTSFCFRKDCLPRTGKKSVAGTGIFHRLA